MRERSDFIEITVDGLTWRGLRPNGITTMICLGPYLTIDGSAATLMPPKKSFWRDFGPGKGALVMLALAVGMIVFFYATMP